MNRNLAGRADAEFHDFAFDPHDRDADRLANDDTLEVFSGKYQHRRLSFDLDRMLQRELPDVVGNDLPPAPGLAVDDDRTAQVGRDTPRAVDGDDIKHQRILIVPERKVSHIARIDFRLVVRVNVVRFDDEEFEPRVRHGLQPQERLLTRPRNQVILRGTFESNQVQYQRQLPLI